MTNETDKEKADREARRKAALKVARKAPAGSGAREKALKDAQVYKRRKNRWV